MSNDPMSQGLMGNHVTMDAQGNVGQQGMQPMMPYMPQQMHQQQMMYMPPQNPDMYQGAPNGIPTPGMTNQNTAATQSDQSKLDAFEQKWYTSRQNSGMNQPNGANHPQQTPNPNGQQQPNQQQPQQPESFDLSAFGPEAFHPFANNIDFTQGMPDQILEMFTADENGAQPRLMEGIMHAMNYASRQAYAQAMAGGAKLAHRGISDFGKTFEGRMPSMMRNQAAQDAMQKLNVPSLLRPSVDAAVSKFLQFNPDASSDTIQEMLSDFMESSGFGTRKTQQEQQRAANPLGNLFE